MEANWIHSSYESVSATCEHCGKENIFNRASDLGGFDAVSGLEVNCLQPGCGKPFWIIGDSINPDFETVFFDTQPLYQLKRYGLCIAGIAQAWEMFFANFLRVELLYRQYASNHDLSAINTGLRKLFEGTKSWTFEPMRSVFLHSLIDRTRVASVDALLANFAVLRSKPSEADLEAIDIRFRERALRVHRSRIGELRNSVVHKVAYRPGKDEVDGYVREAQEVMIPLGHALGVEGDDVGWYAQKFRPQSG